VEIVQTPAVLMQGCQHRSRQLQQESQMLCIANHQQYALPQLQVPMAAGMMAWKMAGGYGGGMQGKGRWSRPRSTSRRRRRTCPTHLGAHQSGATPEVLCADAGGDMLERAWPDLLSSVRAVNRLRLACQNCLALSNERPLVLAGGSPCRSWRTCSSAMSPTMQQPTCGQGQRQTWWMRRWTVAAAAHSILLPSTGCRTCPQVQWLMCVALQGI
jgi:hypothetical protein